ncbi:Catenin delta-2 [Chlorella vulgaris]
MVSASYRCKVGRVDTATLLGKIAGGGASNQAHIVAAGTIPALSQLLDSSDASVRAAAAAALELLRRHHPTPAQQPLRGCFDAGDAISRLIAQLGDRSDAKQSAAARALGSLASGPANWHHIAAKGAIPLLVSPLPSGTAEVLLRGRTPVVLYLPCHASSTVFLSYQRLIFQVLSCNVQPHYRCRRPQLGPWDAWQQTCTSSKPSWLPGLIQLLQEYPGGVVQLAAATALWRLCFDNRRNQQAATGAIPALVRLLSSGATAAVQEAAAGALEALVCDNSDNQQATAAAGAIPALVRLLGSGVLAAVQEAAAGALEALLLLDSSSPDLRQAAAAALEVLPDHATPSPRQPPRPGPVPAAPTAPACPAAPEAGDSSSPQAKDCPICYESFSLGDMRCLVPCGHGPLCGGCTNKIMRRNKECPICRNKVTVYVPATSACTPASRQSVLPHSFEDFAILCRRCSLQ